VMGGGDALSIAFNSVRQNHHSMSVDVERHTPDRPQQDI
jgi:hypothetical protein